MAEQLDLTAAIVPPTRTSYHLASLLLDWDAAYILARVIGSDGLEIRCEYTGATATALMTTLNTANLSVTSLYKRVLQKLVTDGKLPAGTVSGSPQ